MSNKLSPLEILTERLVGQGRPPYREIPEGCGLGCGWGNEKTSVEPRDSKKGPVKELEKGVIGTGGALR